MSKERELLNKAIEMIQIVPLMASIGHAAPDFGSELILEIQELLAQPEQDLEVLKKDWVNFGYEAGRKSALSKQEPLTPRQGLEEYKRGYAQAELDLKREPLSDEEIVKLWASKSPANEFECVRLVEKAHGIGVEL